MRLDSANRAFVVLVAVALAPYLLLGVLGCGLLSYLALRVAADGPAVLTEEAELGPAVAFFAVLGTGTLLTLRSLWRQHGATRRLAAHVDARRVPVTSALTAAADRADLGDRVDLVASEEPWSFTYGLFAPRVAVTTTLAASGAGELDAVLAHERYHVGNLDPLKVVVARSLAAAFFFLPVLRHLLARYLVGRELAADRCAVAAAGRASLAAALYRVIDRPQWTELRTAAAIGGEAHLDVRVAQLETGEEPPLPPVPPTTTVITGLALVLLLAALAATVFGVRGADGVMSVGGSGMMDSAGGGMTVLGGVVCAGAWLTGGLALIRRLVRRPG